MKDSKTAPVQPVRVGFEPIKEDFIPYQHLGKRDGLWWYSVKIPVTGLYLNFDTFEGITYEF